MTDGEMQARSLYMRATKADSTHAASWVSLGKLEERQKRQEKARECYSKRILTGVVWFLIFAVCTYHECLHSYGNQSKRSQLLRVAVPSGSGSSPR
jgi:hypothetical protein